MSCTGTADCLCGCCAGASVQTPQVKTNLPGQSSISYRAGIWATFKETMLARLSSSDYPALARLKTRNDDDFTIAFLDATAVVLDILTFYQERLANESYLGTATQTRSLTELSRLIGYQPSPGVSASVYLAFTLKAAPGQPTDPTAPAITIPAGTQVQSVPAQGQKPQVFETSADIAAKPDWNALPVLTGQPWTPQIGDTSVYLQGTATQLQPGDLFLIVGDERLQSSANNNWDVRVVTTVQADTTNNRTYVAWSDGLGYAHRVKPAQQHPKFYAFRQRATLFGYNAINPLMLAKDVLTGLAGAGLVSNGTSKNPEWLFSLPQGGAVIDLDAVYAKVVPHGWIVLIVPDMRIASSPAGFVSLYQVKSVTTIARSAYAISSKISRVGVDTNTSLSEYYAATRQTSVLAQTDELEVAEQPLSYPLYGTVLDLAGMRPDLVGVQALALSGTSQKIAVAEGVTALSFVPDDPTMASMNLNPGDLLTVTDPKPLPLNPDGSVPNWSSLAGPLILNVEDAEGRPGTVSASLNDFTLAPSASSDPEVSEYALVKSVLSATTPYPHAQILLQSNLLNCYDRKSTTVNANVGLATNGQSVSEIMGSGSASTPNQEFTLKQSPLTYVPAPTPTGRQSTLQVLANGTAWSEVPSLYEQGPSAQVFATLNQSDGTTDVLFGDGVEGATLPTGQNNILANYRIGLGSAGNVAAGAISTLIDRPLGVSGVTNPQAATGGGDPDSIDDIRSSAPQSVLTLGRAVSITDFQSYASTFAGIAKAHAIWIPNGPGRGVFLTVAGANGAALPPGNPTLAYLVASLQNYGNPLVPITAMTFLETLFGLSADLAYDPAYDQPTVQAAVLQALTETYSFANRTFGQGVSADEVSAVIQAVPGVVAVNVTEIQPGPTSAAGDLASQGTFSISTFNSWLSQQVTNLPRPASGSNLRICPYIPVASSQGLPQPAEILVLDPNPNNVVLGVMS
jgi:hypothetical protein